MASQTKRLLTLLGHCVPAQAWRRGYSSKYAAPIAPVAPVASTKFAGLTLNAFRETAFGPETPLVITPDTGHVVPAVVPAVKEWFRNDGAGPRLSSRLYQTSILYANFPFEVTVPAADAGPSALDTFADWLAGKGVVNVLHTVLDTLDGDIFKNQTRVVCFHAPMILLALAHEYNATLDGARDGPVTHMYIAQKPIDELPPELQADLPVPLLVQKSGRGDVYGSSVWLGLEPTYTPWHRDPNPNLFVQLCGAKTVRLMPPKAGERVFRAVQQQLQKRQQPSGGSARIRGEEMLNGAERELLHEAIWGATAGTESLMQETTLNAGAMLFIPKGWWHSIRSVGADGSLNSSANWWFR